MLFTILLTIALAFGTETQHSPSQDILSSASIEYKFINEACKTNVSQTDTQQKHYVADVLNVECAAPEGYEITLVDSEHFEQLEINQNQFILIKGGNGSATIWKAQNETKKIINLVQGDLTLQNIEFQFTIINGTEPGTEPILNPRDYIIYAENDKLRPSLTLKQCTFQSISGVFDNDIFQIFICDVTKAEFIDCSFKGAGIDKVSNVSMIHIESCNFTTLKKCKFQDAQIYHDVGPITLEANFKGSQITIQDCEFTNITLIDEDSYAVLQVTFLETAKSKITGNTFINCSNVNQFTGALLIADALFDGSKDKYVFSNNTFTNNTGKISGSIYVLSNLQQLHYDFSDNNFKLNKNNVTDGLGQDAYFNFSNPSQNWTVDIITKELKGMFKGSISDAKNASVYFETYKDYKDVVLSGFITLPNSQTKKWYQNKYVIIGIACGAVVLIIAIIVIIICCVYCRKRRATYSSKGQEKDPLIPHTQQRSV
ncbi:MAG: hypothetical protein EZS28_024509 [Streblomastix strix]|uniref:Right handed beta helix domain-containing protein n=1 Tax=Streblomastix strix TaxID=222440 RepID=A0A5J4VC72_9EUKA|nr:MAG: hypothetical protein EZS28_024509 [Streblomastix strix]